MRKLKLQLEQLAVESFSIQSYDGRGTIEGFWISQDCATDGLTCNGPVGGSCGGGQKSTCAYTYCIADTCGTVG